MIRQVEFTPRKGLMSMAERIVRDAGLGHLWGGENGFMGVASDLLKKVPERIELSPRGLAEQAGIVKRRRKTRRLK